MTYQIPDYSNTVSVLADQLHIGQHIEVYYGSIKKWEPGTYLGDFSFLPDNPSETQKRLRKDARIRVPQQATNNQQDA